jgi:septal ring factor EnvC (AmiA/AmiB activator)
MANYFNTLNLREKLDQLGRCRFMERMKVYYQHLNQVRIDMINNLKATQENLAKQREAISGQRKGM